MDVAGSLRAALRPSPLPSPLTSSLSPSQAAPDPSLAEGVHGCFQPIPGTPFRPRCLVSSGHLPQLSQSATGVGRGSGASVERGLLGKLPSVGNRPTERRLAVLRLWSGWARRAETATWPACGQAASTWGQQVERWREPVSLLSRVSSHSWTRPAAELLVSRCNAFLLFKLFIAGPSANRLPPPALGPQMNFPVLRRSNILGFSVLSFQRRRPRLVRRGVVQGHTVGVGQSGPPSLLRSLPLHPFAKPLVGTEMQISARQSLLLRNDSLSRSPTASLSCRGVGDWKKMSLENRPPRSRRLYNLPACLGTQQNTECGWGQDALPQHIISGPGSEAVPASAGHPSPCRQLQLTQKIRRGEIKQAPLPSEE